MDDLKYGKFSDLNKYRKAVEFYKSKEEYLHIDSTTGLTIEQVSANIENVVYKTKNLRIVLLDHLLQVNFMDRFDGLGDLTKELKRLAIKHDITIVALSQLNRGVEKRDNKKPLMSDLSGSGSIEQDADTIVMLYRPEYYLEGEWNEEKNGPYVKKEIEDIELIVRKNRDGKTGVVNLKFESRFADVRDVVVEVVYEYEENTANIDDRGEFRVEMPVI
jgi:replicative DNA helicase